MRTHIDEIAIKEYARQSGWEEGREEGLQIGIETIASLTGMSIEDIQVLKC